MRRLSVALSFVAAPCEALSRVEDVAWFTVAQSPERVAWNAGSSPSVCALDVFQFGVQFPALNEIQYKDQDTFKWQLIAKKVDGYENGAVMASGPLKVAILDREEFGQEEDREETAAEEEEGGLKCEFDTEFCVPKLVGIRLPDVDAESEDGASLQKDHSIVFEFEQPTSRPQASSKEEIDRFVSFTEYVGGGLVGTWSIDGRELVIRIMEIDEDKVKPVGELMQGLLHTSIYVAVDNEGDAQGVDEMALFEGVQRLRIEPPGTYMIRVFGSDEVVIWSPEVSLQPCEAAHVVMDPTHATLDPTSDIGLSNEIISDTAPSFALDGVLTHGGDEGFVLQHDSIQMEMPGSWSLSLWVFLTEDSTSSFRTLFFNGDGEHQQRTPSAWWKPDDRRLVLRVSTNTSSDVGLDSSEELPLNQWIHMGFTFINCSESDITGEAQIPDACPQNQTDTESWSYLFAFYLNGLLDTEVRIYEPVVSNAGPLQIGKGPWTDGMQGFTSNLKVFPVPISSEEQRKLYFSERHNHENYADCLSDDNLYFDTAVLAAAKIPATQISFLSQCLNYGGGSVERVEGTVTEIITDRETPNNFVDLQTVTFEKAIKARDSCEPNAWDLLVEAADLGHLTASCDVGESHLYGSFAAQDHCPTPIPIQQNWTLAGHFLVKAFSGVHSAGKPLALLLEMSDNEEYPNGDRLGLFTTGFIHFAAASGGMDAFAMLGRRYHRQIFSREADIEIATYHFYHAAVQAANEFHQLGKQPLHKMTRLYDSFERDVTVGERGDDDELIQFQKMRADKGDVGAMAAMGDLYYWGAHGVPRDHAQAYNYFNRAAHAGDVNSRSAVAGMLLKGEGTVQDNVTSIKWYEKAAEKNHTRALNGLGFIHFHGSGGVSENKSLALEYFERAAENEEDGDSVFNAGYCHALGIGTEANISRAMKYYSIAARKFGHFDAIFEMGKILMNGVSGVVPRDSERALEYLKAASDGGQWGRTVRKGFDLFTNDDFERAVVYYHEARELGYPVATSNLAFLYDQRLLRPGNLASERRALKYLLLANTENGDRETLVRIGDYHYYGLAGLRKDSSLAIRWYSRASAEGVDVGAYNVGHMYEFGDGVQANLERAQRYYNRVLEISTGGAEIQLAIQFALARLALRKWLQNTPFEMFLGLKSPLAIATDTNTSIADSAAMFDAATSFFDNKVHVYALISTTAIMVVSIGVWYFYSN